MWISGGANDSDGEGEAYCAVRDGVSVKSNNFLEQHSALTLVLRSKSISQIRSIPATPTFVKCSSLIGCLSLYELRLVCVSTCPRRDQSRFVQDKHYSVIFVMQILFFFHMKDDDTSSVRITKILKYLSLLLLLSLVSNFV